MFGTNPNVGLLNPLAGKPQMMGKSMAGNTMNVGGMGIGGKPLGLGQGVGVQPVTQKDLNRKNSRIN